MKCLIDFILLTRFSLYGRGRWVRPQAETECFLVFNPCKIGIYCLQGEVKTVSAYNISSYDVLFSMSISRTVFNTLGDNVIPISVCDLALLPISTPPETDSPPSTHNSPPTITLDPPKTIQCSKESVKLKKNVFGGQDHEAGWIFKKPLSQQASTS